MGGAGGLIKQGTGTFTLSGVNSYTGPTSVQAGTLTLNGGQAIADTGAVSVAAGASLNLGADETVGSLTSGGTVDGTGKTLTAATYGFTGGTVNANLGGGTLNQTSGITTLNGTSNTNALNISGGTLGLGAGDRLNHTAALNVNGGTLDLGGFADIVGAVTLQGGSIQNGTLAGSGYSLQSGTVVNINGSLLNGGEFKLVGGTVNINSSGLIDTRQYTQTGGTLSGPGQLVAGSATLLGGQMTGPGKLTITGSGGSGPDLVLGGDFILGNGFTLENQAKMLVPAHTQLDGTGTYVQTKGDTQVDGTILVYSLICKLMGGTSIHCRLLRIKENNSPIYLVNICWKKRKLFSINKAIL